MSDFSVHDFVLVDAPMFHFVMYGVSNGEAYNMAIRGGDWGGLDGMSVIGDNVWVHDIMVTNKDECVTVKSPSKNILIENIYCNWSGGCAIGSLSAHTDISTVTYRNIYSWKSNNMMMIKSNGGSGTLHSAVFENFIGHGNAYSLKIDQAWSSMQTLPGDGVQLSNLVFKNWKGTAADGSQRGPVVIVCADKKPCYDIKITDFSMWTDAGSMITNRCRSAWGEGFCLKKGTPAAYPVITANLTSAPAGYEAPRMPDDVMVSFGIDKMIPIPAIPKSFFPNTKPLKKVAGQ
ncbi:hypothetical protein IAQ61_010065 [Plenodomus lingam]|uniref:uncharacterized protein n=1 Tax=Leptosphaeria maculans TaxID=5022 RepID=UPI003316B65C|nr:hypothetical protein IAQ61_010065 [Plenodomus lingam]